MKSRKTMNFAAWMLLLLFLAACGGANSAANDNTANDNAVNRAADEDADMNNVAANDAAEAAEEPGANDIEDGASDIGDPEEVIYGIDQRYEGCDTCSGSYSDTLLNELSQSVAVLVRPSAIYETSDNLTWNAYTLQERLELTYNLPMCTEERFADQPAPGFCTGFLLDEQHLVTARHCVPTPEACAETQIVFDFTMNEDGEVQPLTQETVYNCAGVYYDALDALDVVVLTLDRATGRPGLPLADQSTTISGDLVVIGHPSGLPRKLAVGAEVLDNDLASDYFVTDLDSFAGNSGSPVFDLSIYAVVGMLLGGEVDYEKTANSCIQVKVCDAASGECTGEAVLRVENFIDGWK